MKLKDKIKNIFWNLRFFNKKIKLNLSQYKISLVNQFLPRRSPKPDISNIKSILLVRNDRHGDMIVTTGLINNLYHAGYDIYISSEASSLEIIKFNPYVKNYYSYDGKNFLSFIKSIINIRKYEFDIVIDLKLFDGKYKENIFFCSFIKSPIIIGLNKNNIRSYNISIPYNYPHDHITKINKLILDILNIKNKEDKYEIFISKEIEKHTTDFIKNSFINKKIAVINPFGADKSRWITQEQLNTIINLLSPAYNIIVIGELQKIKNLNLPDNVLHFPSPSILYVVPLIEKSDILISVDTSIVHLATSFFKKTIALYLNPIDNKKVSPQKKAYKQKVAQYRFALNNPSLLKKDLNEINVPLNTINYKQWGPNNPNAKILVFNYQKFPEVPFNEFELKIKPLIENI